MEEPTQKPRGRKPTEKGPCLFEGCDQISKVRGYCQKHYMVLRHTGELPKIQGVVKYCSVKGCKHPPYRQGYCGIHFARWQSFGDATVTHNRRGRKLKERKGNKVVMPI